MLPPVPKRKFKIPVWLQFVLFFSGLLLLLFVVTGIGLYFETKELSPEGKAFTYAEYRREMTAPTHAERVHLDGKVYYITTGRMSSVSSWLTFPSGPPQYVFDEQGDLVDWAMDIGEALYYNKKWRSDRANREPFSVQELDKLLLGKADK